MTGTAMTEAEEFAEIYGLEVIEIPTNVPVVRDDHDDEVYRTGEGEVRRDHREQIEDCQERGSSRSWSAPSRSRSRSSCRRCSRSARSEHKVLNARYHEQEAFIIAQAGAPGAVTIATNMAGRGTDIQLGGNVEMRIAAGTAEIEDEAERARRSRRDRRPRSRRRPRRRCWRPAASLRARHRAPREPPHRQPAARPLRPPGRPGRLQVLPVAGRRPDAHLRLRAHGRHAAASWA